MVQELEVLLEQVGELLADWPTEPDDAIELASVAGLAARLGATDEQLEEADAWRDGPGAALLDEGWAEAEIEEAVEGVEAVCGGSSSNEDIEEALFEFDDLVAAAIWSNKTQHLRKPSKRVAHAVRDVPEVFSPLADFASETAKLEAIARDLDLYDYWIAIAQASEWAEGVTRKLV